MDHLSEKKYPVSVDAYKLYEEVGEGVSATVYRALCIPLNEIVAIKVLDLERCNNDLDGIRREVQTMSLINHPNLLHAHCSFTTGHSLWVLMPYMSGGSCLQIMKSAYPDGFEEFVIATLLQEVLKALVYLHVHGHIHRDVKAGNILIESNGAVKLADFGVSACMFDTGDRQRSRNTFSGTPCWMAPEVMQQLHGYDFKADIWSFGITALELAHGHAPFSKYPPMKVLLMTLQNAPPGLDYERDKRFSKSFKEMVAACLVKDPKKRPTSEKLLKHHFFKRARSADYLARTILDALSPLGDRYSTLKSREADLLVQNKALYGDKEHLSQQEYIRGISAWNFNLEDLKNQAALEDDVPKLSESQGVFQTEWPSPDRANNSNAVPIQEEGLSDLQNFDSSFASFPTQPLQALKGYFDVGENDATASSSNMNDPTPSDFEQKLQVQDCERNDAGYRIKKNVLPSHVTSGHKKLFSGSLIHDNDLSPKKVNGHSDRDSAQPRYQTERNYSGPLIYRQKRDTSNLSSSVDDTSGGAVQCKGRFKIMSEELSPMGSRNCFTAPQGGSTSTKSPSFASTSVLSSLQSILQQNSMQRGEIVKLINYMEQTCGNQMDFSEVGINDVAQTYPPSSREKELQFQVIHLQQSVGDLAEELQRQKMKNLQLEKQLNVLFNKGE